MTGWRCGARSLDNSNVVPGDVAAPADPNRAVRRASGMLHAYTDEQRGTDQIQRNIVGGRALGLSKEPSNDGTTSLADLPRNV